jgi:hypothetical protein
MDHWIKTTYQVGNEINEKRSIQLPKCPKCKTTIRRSIRYSNTIRHQLKLFEEIKQKQYGDQQNNQLVRSNLLTEIKKSPSSNLSQMFINRLKADLEYYDFSFNELASLQNNWTIFKSLSDIGTKSAAALRSSPPQKAHIQFEINKILSYLYNKTNDFIFLNEFQQKEELFMELERIEYLTKYYEFANKAKSIDTELNTLIEVGSLLAQCELYLIRNVKPFDVAQKKSVEGFFQRLVRLVKVELTPREKTMIVAAMGLQKGHWYKCPNGHTYCIGECGGAMEQSFCPECKSVIGGTNHSLVAGNRHAGDFDNSQYAAWSDTANNMANWDI